MADAGGHITEEARTVPVLCRTDVLVAGGGHGGLAAGGAAARSGGRTVLGERHGCFGGVINQTGV